MLQLSDLHFGADFDNAHPSAMLCEHLMTLIRDLEAQPVLLISGDITFQAKARGYQEAKQFFDRLKEGTGLDGKRFVFCPGNHDLDRASGFHAYDAFVYDVRRDDECGFASRSCGTLTVDGLTFVLVNSAHHHDHRYGLVDVAALRALALPADRRQVIAVSHHHVIPTEHHDCSTIRNAYAFLTALDSSGIRVLLHGHQHLSRGLPVGDTPVSIFGVNSFNYHMKGGQNALNQLTWRGDQMTFQRRIFVHDGIRDAGPRFEALEEHSIP